MNTPRVRIVNPVLAVVLTASAFIFSTLSGCNGGTSTEAGNPGLTLEFRENGHPVEIPVALQFFVANSNPEFNPAEKQDYPDAVYFPNPSRTVTLSRKELLADIAPRAQLWLQKTSAAQDKAVLPDFNIVVLVEDDRMSLLAGIHMDPETGKFSVNGGGTPGDNLIVDISKEKNYTGTVDTSTAAGKPIALFVPGTNFYAQVRKNKFTFLGVPAGRMPMRWISANGEIRDMPDSLGGDWTKPLQPGERVDSIALPNVVAVRVPSATPAGQLDFTDSLSVALSSETGADIYFSLDGSTPDSLYRDTIKLRSSATIRAVAYIKGRIHSDVSINNYTLVPAQPVALPAGQTFRDTLRITLTTTSEDAVIHYTLDGSEPTSGSRAYEQPFLIDSTTTLKSVTEVSGLSLSRVTEEKYIRMKDSLPATPMDSLEAMPVADPPAGTYSDSVRIGLATASKGALIYYTLDGSEPSVNSSVFQSDMTLIQNTTLKAIAVDSVMGKSPVLTADYIVGFDSLPVPP